MSGFVLILTGTILFYLQSCNHECSYELIFVRSLYPSNSYSRCILGLLLCIIMVDFVTNTNPILCSLLATAAIEPRLQFT